MYFILFVKNSPVKDTAAEPIAPHAPPKNDKTTFIATITKITAYGQDIHLNKAPVTSFRLILCATKRHNVLEVFVLVLLHTFNSLVSTSS